MPFLLLGAALVAFLASTRQWAFQVRLAVWGVGVVLLAAALFATPADGEEGLIRAMLANAAGHWRTPGDSVIAQLLSNWSAVSGAIPSMLNVAAALAGVLAVAALVAMSPGETVERIIRPINIGLIGAVFGAVATLALIAGGFAGYQKDRVYVGRPAASDVIDGDTLRFGDVSLRLFGVDAPEHQTNADGPGSAANQTCLMPGPTRVACGQRAREKLQELVRGRLVVCKPPQDRPAGEPPQETFGRPIVVCTAQADAAAATDVNRALVEEGYAAAYFDGSGLQVGDYREAARFQFGCTLRPGVWRHDDRKRQEFIDGVFRTITADDLIGRCPGITVPG
ncbi:MAG: thermonuclease family protein [Hyphomonadaceae bacterium]|nr:thermonuclease family protein [Hyphomonadaceae bacterium]